MAVIDLGKPFRPAIRVVGLKRLVARNPVITGATFILVAVILIALFAPALSAFDPLAIQPRNRLRPPSAANWFGTDQLGRDLYTRVIYGTRISLIVGLSVAAMATAIGLLLGVLAGFVVWLDAILMRIMDGLMAIPGILLAIALTAISEPSVEIVIIAITIPETPRVTRLVRSVVLTLRGQLYVEAARALGTPFPKLILRHILPHTTAPVIVQATYVCASAIMVEAMLSFLGVGTPSEVPSWGNIIAENRALLAVAPWLILFPGLFIAAVVLSVNVLGDGLRDSLDPRLRQRLKAARTEP